MVTKIEALTEPQLPIRTVLETVAGLLGLQHSPNELARASRVPRDSGGDAGWQFQLAQAAEHLGLATSSLDLSPREALRQAKRESPLVTFAPHDSGAPRWLVVGGRSGKRADVIELAEGGISGGRLDTTALAELLGGTEPRLWVALDNAMPLECLRKQPNRGVTATREALGRLWRLLRLEGHSIGIVAVYALITGLFALATPLTAQALVNTIAFGSLIQPLVVIAVLLLGMLIAVGGLRLIQAWVVELVQRRLFVRVVADLSARLPRVSASAREQTYQPEMVNRFFDVVTIQKAASGLLLDGLELMLTAGIGLIVLAFYHPLLLAFDVVLLLALIAITVGLGGGAVRTALYESKAKYKVAAWLEELARHPYTFGSRRGGRAAAERADALARGYLDARGDHFRRYLRQLGGAFLLQALASAALLGLGGYLVLKGQLTLGQLVAAELIVTAVVASIAKFGKHLETFYDLSAAVDKLGQLIDLPLEETEGEVPPDVDGPVGLALRSATLTRRVGGVVLEDIDLIVKPGEHLALIGPGGSGKSTLLDTLWGARTPASGQVLCDGRDLASLDKRAWRDRAALLREPELIEGTIEDNLRLDRPNAKRDTLEVALGAVGLLGVIERLGGLEATVTTGGAPLSASERASLLVARALVSRPRLMLLDGILDGIEADSRERLLDALFAPNAPWTVVVATGNRRVAQRCDRVLRPRDRKLEEVTP
jgi:putative ABC transport system ATP-binding protein